MADQHVASKSERTKDRILDAAARIFREVGYTAASLRDIAEEAGMQAGSLYYHFESKEQLAEEVMTVGVDGSYATILSAMDDLSDTASTLDKLEAAFSAHLSYLLDQSDYAVAMLRMLHQTPQPLKDRILARQRTFGQFFGRLLEQAQKEEAIKPGLDLSSLRMLVFGAMNWTPEWYTTPGLSPAELATQLRRMIER